MKTKPKDIKYCGVSRKMVKRAEPTINYENWEHFKDFVIERYRVHKRKDVKGLKAPWTRNPVLQEFKFTNVRREHDTQTKFLIDNIVKNDELTIEDKIVNIFMFRAWNNWSTLEYFGAPWPAFKIYSKKLKEVARKKYNACPDKDTRLWWSNAYNQGGTKAAWKFPAGDGYQRAYKESDAKEYPDWEETIALRPFHIGPWLKKQNIVNRLLNAESQEECFNIIKSVRGFADFLAYQVYVDLTYIPEFPFSENEFVVAGPGCKRGLDHIFDDFDGMNYSEAMFWVRDNCDRIFEELSDKFEWCPEKLFSDLPEYDRCMNVMSIENCMCELSKYIKAVNGTGRPRCKYKGGK